MKAYTGQRCNGGGKMRSDGYGSRQFESTTQGVELLALHRITELIGSAVDLEITLERILKVVNNTLKMERATLLLYDPRSRSLAITASCGLSEVEEMRGVYKPDEGVFASEIQMHGELRRII